MCTVQHASCSVKCGCLRAIFSIVMPLMEWCCQLWKAGRGRCYTYGITSITADNVHCCTYDCAILLLLSCQTSLSCVGVSGMQAVPSSMLYSAATSWHWLASRTPCSAALSQEPQLPQQARQSARWTQQASRHLAPCRQTAACLLHLLVHALWCMKLTLMLGPAAVLNSQMQASCNVMLYLMMVHSRQGGTARHSTVH